MNKLEDRFKFFSRMQLEGGGGGGVQNSQDRLRDVDNTVRKSDSGSRVEAMMIENREEQCSRDNGRSLSEC